MATCAKCDSTVFEGHPCIGCGHVTIPPAPAGGPAAEGPGGPGVGGPVPPGLDAPAASGRPKKSSKGSDDESDGSKLAVIGVAAVAAVVLIGAAFFMLGGDSSTPSTEAAPTEIALADEEVVAVLDDTFCQSPGAIAGAPEPSATDANAFTVYTKPDALGYAADADAIAAAFDGAWGASAESAYAVCIEGGPGDQDQTCRGYGQGITHRMLSKSYTYAMYEVASGALVREGNVGSLPMTCPSVAMSGSQTIQAVDSYDLGVQIVNEILPGDPTGMHLVHDLNFGDPSWCSSPATIDYAGTAVTEPSIWFLGAWDYEKSNHVAWAPEEVSHVACAQFVPNTEEDPHLCEYDNGKNLKTAKGVFEVTVIDMLTGELVSAESFEGTAGCPGVLLGDPPRKPRDPNIPADAYRFVEAAAGVVDTGEATDSAEG